MIDDYGHHPTEIRATLAAAKQCGYRKIHVIFQPHRYTRTRDLMDEFATAFGDADSLQVLDIYAASEQPIEGITGEALARKNFGETGNARPSELRILFVRPSFEEAVAAATAQCARRRHDSDIRGRLGVAIGADAVGKAQVGNENAMSMHRLGQSRSDEI